MATFDWVNDDSIVCREQLAIAVYTNTSGGIVILRERQVDEEDDVCIVLRPECARAVAAAILEAAAGSPAATAALPARPARSHSAPRPPAEQPLLIGDGLADPPVRTVKHG